jgi:hypothetical protein
VTDGNDWLIDQFAAVPHPYGNSILPALYKLLPHDTDLTVFKEAGIPGMDFAFAEKWSHYHTGLDLLESIDQRSVQHHGEYALEVTRRFGNLDLSHHQTGSSVFFSIAGTAMIRHPVSWAPVLAILAGLLTLFAITVGFRKGRLRVTGLLPGLVALFAAGIVSGILARFFPQFIAGLINHLTAFFESGFYYLSLFRIGFPKRARAATSQPGAAGCEDS